MARAYTVYCDASGQPSDGDVLFVSGFGSTASKWLRFGERWNNLLRAYDIHPPFHMNEFAPGVGQFASWKQDKARRNQFFQQVIKILKISTLKSFSVGVAVSDLRRFQQDYQLPDNSNGDSPYTFCGVLLYKQVNNWAQRHGEPTDTLQIIFEHGDKDQGQFVMRLRELFPGLDDPIFKRKSDCVPFQAADILAWEHHRHVLHGAQRVRESYAELRKHIPRDRSWMFFDQYQFSHIRSKRPLPRRVESRFR